MNLHRVLLFLAACWWLFAVWDASHQQSVPFALQHEARP